MLTHLGWPLNHSVRGLAIHSIRSRFAVGLIQALYRSPVMDTKQLKDFCGKLPGATSRLHGHPGNVLVYPVGGKNFAWFKNSDPEK